MRIKGEEESSVQDDCYVSGLGDRVGGAIIGRIDFGGKQIPSEKFWTCVH